VAPVLRCLCTAAAEACKTAQLTHPNHRTAAFLPLCYYAAAYTSPDGQPATAALTDVCFKPFGTACATQSILQYWHMDGAFYASEQAKGKYSTKLSPDYCFGHWATQCRSAFEAPMDPHVILGGFSTGPDFR
jgi:hypothetical protein